MSPPPLPPPGGRPPGIWNPEARTTRKLSPIAVKAEADSRLAAAPELFEYLGDIEKHILSHLDAVFPQEGDLDLALNSDPGSPTKENEANTIVTTIDPSGVNSTRAANNFDPTVDIATGSLATHLFRARLGHVAFVKALRLLVIINPTALNTQVVGNIIIEVDGRQIGNMRLNYTPNVAATLVSTPDQFTRIMRYEKPLIIDRGNRIRIVSTFSGIANISISATLEGWLRPVKDIQEE